jgi:hypothetical protein
LGKAEADTEAETAETETARYPRVQKIQQPPNLLLKRTVISLTNNHSEMDGE